MHTAPQVSNKDGALFQLPQLLASLRLVPQEDASRYLVVVTYSTPAQVPLCRLPASSLPPLSSADTSLRLSFVVGSVVPSTSRCQRWRPQIGVNSHHGRACTQESLCRTADSWGHDL